MNHQQHSRLEALTSQVISTRLLGEIKPSPECAPAWRSAPPGTSPLAEQKSTIGEDLLTCMVLGDLSAFILGYPSALKYTPDLDGSKGQPCLQSPDLQEINGKLLQYA